MAVVSVEAERYRDDPDLPELLARLDGLPLAVELVAHRAQAEPDAATVMRLWHEEQAGFIRRGRGGSKDLELGASIALSLSSPRMTDAGRRLFALLGRLPHGLAHADVDAIMPNVGAQAATSLRRTGLVLRDQERLRMLAPIREHAASHQLDAPQWDALLAYFGALADALPFFGD